MALYSDPQKTGLSLTSKPAGIASSSILPIAALLLMPAANLCAEETAQPAPTELETIHVSAEKQKKAVKYKGEKTRAGRMLQDPKDIPQAVTIVPVKMVEEQGGSTLKDAMKNVSGLTFNAAEGGRSGDNMMLRGFYTYGDMYMDGIRDTAQYYRETFNLEQIDVLRGSAAMLFGRGQAGGVINQVSKTAQLEDLHELEVSAGDYKTRRVNADFNQVLGETTAARINYLYRDEDSWRINPASATRPKIRRDGVHLTGSTGIGTHNLWTAAVLRTRSNDRSDYGMSFDSATRRPTKKFVDTDYWGTEGNFDKSENLIGSLLNVYKFRPNIQLRTQLRDATYQRSYWAIAPNNSTAPTANPPAGGANKTRQTDNHNLAIQSDLLAKLNWGKTRHNIIAGLEYFEEDGSRSALKNIGTTRVPDYEAGQLVYPGADYKGKTYSILIQDMIDLTPKWSVLGGLRYDDLRANYTALQDGTLHYNEPSYRAGISYKPNPMLHWYLSYSNGFSPTADLYQVSGGAMPAERNNTVELGLKWELLDGDLAFRSALFRTNKLWERNTDLDAPPSNSILSRKRRTQGIEFELTGNITPQWQIFSGLAFFDPRIIEVAENLAANGSIVYADARLQGQVARNTPKHTLNVWTTYNLTDHWRIGGGLEGKGKRFVYNPATTNASALFTADGTFDPNTAPGYMIYNAMLEYSQKNWAVQLNLKNLTNKLYYEDLYDNGGFAVPGFKRFPMLTLRYNF